MEFSRKVEEIIRARHSCRTYTGKPIDGDVRSLLEKEMGANVPALFGTVMRFRLIAAQGGDEEALKRLGTYGMIKDAPAYITGAVHEGGLYLEDYGYRMERIILTATDAGLGTCWLGGTFARSDFSRRMQLEEGETIPAVASVGYAADKKRMFDSLVRIGAGADKRKPWSVLFFDGDFNFPLAQESAREYIGALEMVRLAPSASNHQPWRVVREKANRRYHFYLQRTKNYRERWAFVGKADLQRIDMGIAMCHFEAAAGSGGIRGSWTVRDPGIPLPGGLCTYTATWQEG
jgi:nitroreductase